MKITKKGVFNISKEQINAIDTLKLITKIVSIIMIMLMSMLVVTTILYKPVYKVTLENKEIGNIEDKKQFISMLDEFLNQSNEEIAFVHINEKPSYKFILTKRQKEINDLDVLALVEAEAIVYNRVYTVNTSSEEIATFKTKVEAEQFVSDLSNKNIDKDIEFVVNESHIANPTFTEYEQAMNTVKEKYEVKKVSTSNLSTRISSYEYDSNISVAFASPARGTITSRYGYRSSDFHTGIDIANPVGTPIYSAADGTVIFSGDRGTYGRTVIIQHDNNMITYYAHCDKLLVQEGDNVKLGDQIATIGLTGRTTGPHVHFEVRINNEAVNPQKYVKNIGK